MGKLISCYLWAFKNVESGIKSVKSVRKFYEDADVFINVDYDGNFEDYNIIGKTIGAVVTKNNFQIGYCGNHSENLGYDCWTREKTFEWVRGIYHSCKSTDSKYMMLLEEDDFVLKPISVFNQNFSMMIHPTDPSPTGWYRPNNIPFQYMRYISDLGGNPISPGYAAGGGTIFNRQQFIDSWEIFRNNIWDDYDYLRSHSKIIGWADYILQFVMQLGGYEISQNNNLCEHWEVKDDWDKFEIVTGMKQIDIIRNL